MEGALQAAIDVGAFDAAIWIIVAGMLRATMARLSQDAPNLLKALDRRVAVRRALRASDQSDRDHAYKVLKALLD